MPEPVCRSQESGGYEMVFLLLALNWVFHTKYYFISSRSWVKNPRYKSKKTCSYTKVSMQDEQENNSRKVTTHGNGRTRTHLFS